MYSIKEREAYERRKQMEVDMMLDFPYKYFIYIRAKELIQKLESQRKFEKASVIQEMYRAFDAFTRGDKSQRIKAKMLDKYIKDLWI